MPKSGPIQKIIDDRGIKCLVHFTPLNNINSILNKGFYTRQDIENDVIDAYCLDNVRADGLKNSISLSVSFPNDRMFYSRRNSFDCDWGVIVLDSSLMVDLDCAFFPTNAALKDFRSYSIDVFKTPQALERIFCNKLITSKREVLRSSSLLNKDPTCVQSEIMVFEHIPTKYIKGCVFNSNTLQEQYSSAHTNLKFVSNEGCYGVFDNRETARLKDFTGY